jgi:hypothetical protein
MVNNEEVVLGLDSDELHALDGNMTTGHINPYDRTPGQYNYAGPGGLSVPNAIPVDDLNGAGVYSYVFEAVHDELPVSTRRYNQFGREIPAEIPNATPYPHGPELPRAN